jgi:hypothetical protein
MPCQSHHRTTLSTVGLAYKQRSHRWVSEFADESSEDGDMGSKSMEYLGHIHTSKKRCYVDSVRDINCKVDQLNKTRR